MLLNLPSSRENKPPRLLIYGQEGIGKSTLASRAPNPVLIDTEGGCGALDIPSFGLMRSYEPVEAAIRQLLREEHGYRTVVVDSVDQLEPLIWGRTCELNRWPSIEQPGFGKGYIAALDQWRHILSGLDALRNDRDMGVILIAHSEIRRFDSPEVEPFDRYQIKLQTRASALVTEWADCVLFAGYRINVTKTDTGFGRKAARAIGGSDRLLWAASRPAAVAKSRFPLPDALPLSWGELAAAIPYWNGRTEVS